MNDIVEDIFQTRAVRDIQRAHADQSLARSSSRWGADNICVSADAEAWKAALERPFSGSGRWAGYQKYKCGPTECSVNEEKNRNRAPIADGLSPKDTNPSKIGCLILEAKSSFASEDKESLYGIREEDNSEFLKMFRRAGRTVKKFGRRGFDWESWEDLININPMLGPGEGTGYDINVEPADLEDVSGDAWDDRDEFLSAWNIVRQRQIISLIQYEVSCANPDIPLTKYVIILERKFMEDYFETILTPNGHMAFSPFDDGKSWKP